MLIIHRFKFSFLLGLAHLAAATPWAQSADEPAKKTTSAAPSVARHLLLDSRVVDRTEHVELKVGPVDKHPRNPLFGEDKPWEPRYDNMYANVVYDAEDGLYKCWYTPFVASELDENTPREKRKFIKWNVSKRQYALCYADSKDGLVWRKPDLGLVEFRGSSKNNIVLLDVHGAEIIKDEREKDPKRRFKMFGTMEGLGPHMVWFSPDGLHWSEPIKLKLGGRSDTHNNVFWSPLRNEYVGISRVGFQPRTIGRTSSTDFVNWSKIEEVMKPTSTGPHLHDVVVFPYGNVYLGLVGAYDVVADKQWVELAWSPDTYQWHRIKEGTPFIPNSQQEGKYDWGCIFAARPIVLDDQIRLYYSGCNGKFFDWRDGFLCLANVKKDRWAGYRNEGQHEGIVVTKPIEVETANLVICADASEGPLTVSIVDDTGKKIAESQPLRGDLTDAPVQWKAGSDLKSLLGQHARLQFKLQGATLYSFAFVN